MFARIYAAFFYMFVVFTLLAVATPLEGRWDSPPTNPTKTITVTAPGSTATEPASQCTTAQLQCCSSVEDVSVFVLFPHSAAYNDMSRLTLRQPRLFLGCSASFSLILQASSAWAALPLVLLVLAGAAPAHIPFVARTTPS